MTLYPKSLQISDIQEALGARAKELKAEQDNKLESRQKGRPCMRLESDQFKWNPLKRYPRNKGCFCGSGTKAKKCCLPFAAQTVEIQCAQYLNENWELILEGKLTLPKAIAKKEAA